MAAPVANSIILPLDTGNTGKKIRSQTRVIGADTVHSHYFINEDPRSVLGVFTATSGLLTVPAAVHNGTTTGFLWLYNPVGSAIKMQISRIIYDMQFIALAVDLLGGELRCSRFTFTGVNSGTLVTPVRRNSADAANVGQISTSWATAVATLGAARIAVQYPTMGLATGGAGSWNPHRAILNAINEHEEPILAPGEGIVFWHASAVTTANRRLIINVSWDEFE